MWLLLHEYMWVGRLMATFPSSHPPYHHKAWREVGLFISQEGAGWAGVFLSSQPPLLEIPVFGFLGTTGACGPT